MRKNTNTKNKGQTLVEYLLLLSVIVILSLSVFKSRAFKQFFGEDSELFERLRLSMEYSYRNALPGYGSNDMNPRTRYATGVHDSYGIGNRSRFFYTKAYPE